MLAISTHTAVKILCFHTIVEIAQRHIIILVFSEERGVVVTFLNTALIFTAGKKAFHHIVTCYLRNFRNIITVAHPDLCFERNSLEKRRIRGEIFDVCAAVFAAFPAAELPCLSGALFREQSKPLYYSYFSEKIHVIIKRLGTNLDI